MKFKKAAIIGCGGIATNLAPALSRMMDIVLVDGDRYEPKNVERQFPAMHTTANKAIALQSMIVSNTLKSVLSIPEYLKNGFIANKEAWKGVDLVIGCVDNNASRKLIRDLCEEQDIVGILAGNEHEDGEAHAYIPGIYDPFEHHEFTEGEAAPWACNSDKNIELNPQTPLANIMAAAAVFHILLSLRKVKKDENAVVYSRLDGLSSSFSRAKTYLSGKGSAKMA